MLRTKGKHVSIIELVERKVVTLYRHLMVVKSRSIMPKMWECVLYSHFPSIPSSCAMAK